MTEKFLIGTYTRKSSEGIYQVELDTQTERLQNLTLVGKAGSPTYLAESNQHVIYAINRDDSQAEPYGGLVGLDGNTLPASSLQQVMEPGSSPAYVTVDETRQLVLSANYHSGVVTVYRINSDQTLTETDRVQDQGMVGPQPEQADGPHPHYADRLFDQRVLVCDLGLDRLYCYDLDDTGKLHLVNQMQTSPGFGPRHADYVEELGKVYLVGELSSELAVLDYDEETAQLTVQQVVSTIPTDWTTHNGAAAIHISADHRFVYVSNRGNDTLAVFAIQPDGSVKQVQLISTGGEFPRDFNFNCDQRYVVVANQESDNLSLFARNRDTGKLTMLQDNFKVPEGTCVALRKN
ncbi:lactonase family protein [Fructilactobacillus florum]|uniref:lactonase family protein n=1 Tax=Fructilactobacillus florum TaxID=640331 RepID=UPI00028D1165|nr:lactonase family protein [Fructilactobacillus florum]EKK20503.1 6-phosphogluconolactonase [Fructilactobacillus florum 2F]